MTERDPEHVGRLAATELGAEVPPDDAFEQQLPAAGDEDSADEELVEVPDDADPADRAEQARAVVLDDDEYR